MTQEAEEFEQLIGDQLITVGKSLKELLDQGPIELTIDGEKVTLPRVQEGYDAAGKKVPTRLTTIYDATTKLYGGENPIPLLCHREHMKPVAVCRVCMVDVKGSARLVPACQRPIEPKMEVATIRTSERVKSSVKTLTELLLTDHHPVKQKDNNFKSDELAKVAKQCEVTSSRFPKSHIDRGADPNSSLLIAVDHNACILCDRCVRACNDVRKNDVIGRMGKGFSARIAFDLNDPMGESSCVACGECMISCPTGALTNKTVVKTDLDPTGAANAQSVSKEELSKHRLFDGMSDQFLDWNKNAIVRRVVKKGDVICKEGANGSTAFIIVEGKYEVRIRSPLAHVKKTDNAGWGGWLRRVTSGLISRERDRRDDESDKQFIQVDAPVSLEYGNPVATLTPEDFIFGEMTCMSHYPRAATVTAKEDGVIFEILRNVLYMLQRNKVSKSILDDVYRKRSLDSHLRSVKVFANLLRATNQFEQFVEFLRPRAQLVRVQPGQVIFRQGAPADHFYLVRVGFVKVSQERLGVNQVLTYVGPGGYFGEIGLMSHLPEVSALAPAGVRTATCSALDHVELVRIREEDFRELLHQFPKVREQFVAEAVQRLTDNDLQRLNVEHVPLAEYLEQGLMNAQSLLVLDLEKCTRCDECTRACADAHDGVTRLLREGLRFDRYLVASSCRSCLDPYCMVGCPVGSIRRKDSREIIIEDWCIGCGKCAENCPYGNINMHGFSTGDLAPVAHNPGLLAQVVQQKATMCDLCCDLDGQPSCVYACPHDAAHRMSGEELKREIETSRR